VVEEHSNFSEQEMFNTEQRRNEGTEVIL